MSHTTHLAPAIAPATDATPTPPLPPVNVKHTASGRVCAVCEFCGRQSRPVDNPRRGEPGLGDLARGWSIAPFPADATHHDGSTGSLYSCSSCNARLDRGEKLRLRHEPRATTSVRG